jgi:hypothetical protein
MKKNELEQLFADIKDIDTFRRIGDNTDLRFYVGLDSNGMHCFEFVGNYTPMNIRSSEVIVISQLYAEEGYSLRFSLANEDLMENFSIFCLDLLDSTKGLKGDVEAYKTLTARYISWKKLFKPNGGKLTEIEIMGLIGELTFLEKFMIPKYGKAKALESWTGPDRAHKDFSTDDVWYETKAIGSGKESVTISSLEQLDGNIDGYLVVYQLEKMSPKFNGIKLNALAFEVMEQLDSPMLKSIYTTKLEEWGYTMIPEYDDLVYNITERTFYGVKEDFPRLKKAQLPLAIGKVRYDLQLSLLDPFKVEAI